MTIPTETVYYDEGGVRITDKRAVIGQTTYALANITSVGVGEQTSSPCVAIIMMVVGVALAFVGGLSVLGDGGGWYWLVIGAGLLVGGIMALRMARPRYFARINSAAGEQRALVGQDQASVQRVVEALNKAIVQRG